MIRHVLRRQGLTWTVLQQAQASNLEVNEIKEEHMLAEQLTA